SSTYSSSTPRPPSNCRLFPYTTLFRSASLFKDENIKTEYDKIKKPITVNKRFSTYLATSPKTKSPIKQAIALGKTVSPAREGERSEEHTSELQSRFDLVCRLLLEKKNT